MARVLEREGHAAGDGDAGAVVEGGADGEIEPAAAAELLGIGGEGAKAVGAGHEAEAVDAVGAHTVLTGEDGIGTTSASAVPSADCRGDGGSTG